MDRTAKATRRLAMFLASIGDPTWERPARAGAGQLPGPDRPCALS